ncbi:MAG: hypothetical protein GWN62_13840 [Aliifodinibius sp.]|nr:hypothetical protein [Fodinibius sp.]
MIEIVQFRPIKRNTLRGFFDIRLTELTMEIRGLTLHEALNGSHWIGMPSKSYTKTETGELSWQNVVDIYDREKKRKFDRAVLDALKEFRGDE